MKCIACPEIPVLTPFATIMRIPAVSGQRSGVSGQFPAASSGVGRRDREMILSGEVTHTTPNALLRCFSTMACPMSQ